MYAPKYRLDAIETIGRKILLEYDRTLLEGPPQAIPIETIIETKFDLILEYHTLRKNGNVLGETIFDDGAAILYDRTERRYRLIAVKAGTILVDERLCTDRLLGRMRFTCAHELGHWVLHQKLYSGTGDVAAYEGKTSSDESHGLIERQADALATALLMPIPQVKKMLLPFALREMRGTVNCGNGPDLPSLQTGYPRLVEDRDFLTVRLRRESQTTYTPCPPALAPIREKAVCAVCGAGMKRDTKRHGHPRWHCQNPGCGHSLYMDDELLVKQVEERVRRLAQMPLRFKAPTAAAPSMDAVRIENELKLCFNRAELNPEYIKTLIFAAAAERYRELPDPAPRQKGIERGRQAQENPLDGKTLWDFFDVAVSAVRMGQKCLELELAANVTIQTREEEPA